MLICYPDERLQHITPLMGQLWTTGSIPYRSHDRAALLSDGAFLDTRSSC